MKNWAIVLAMLLLVGCYRTPPKLPPGIIAGTGTYNAPSGRYVLSVSRGKQTLIDYAIRDTKTGATWTPQGTFSNVHRWAFFWGSGDRLWCYSGDIGSCVWVPDETGVLAQQWLTPDSPYAEQVPKPMVDFRNRNY